MEILLARATGQLQPGRVLFIYYSSLTKNRGHNADYSGKSDPLQTEPEQL
jgi:hypothetical protein